MYDASDRRHIKAAERDSRVAERESNDIVKGIMSIAAGRAWMLDVLESCHIFSPSFTSDALQMAFSEGERNIGLRLFSNVMRACPQQYILMMQERNERDLAAKIRREKTEEEEDE